MTTTNPSSKICGTTWAQLSNAITLIESVAEIMENEGRDGGLRHYIDAYDIERLKKAYKWLKRAHKEVTQ